MTPFSHSNKVPDPYDVRSYGTDSSGRAILMNARMALALEVACRRLDFAPTITQGAYMSRLGGGAADSAGYHDEGGCLDFRTTSYDELTGPQIGQLVEALRSVGWAAWRRDQVHGGMDPHCHAVLLGDRDAAYGARDQMKQYRDGLDGLASRGRDYEARPTPLVTDFDYHAQVRADMALQDDIAKVIHADGDRTRKALATFRENEIARDASTAQRLAALEALLGDAATKDQIRRARAELAALRAELEETP